MPCITIIWATSWRSCTLECSFAATLKGLVSLLLANGMHDFLLVEVLLYILNQWGVWGLKLANMFYPLLWLWMITSVINLSLHVLLLLFIGSPLNLWILVYRNYWRDSDTALFILKHLYRDIPEDPNSPEESSGTNSKDESGSTGWSDRRETVDEELPLTFSDDVVVRNFSRKAKKIFKKRHW